MAMAKKAVTLCYHVNDNILALDPDLKKDLEEKKSIALHFDDGLIFVLDFYPDRYHIRRMAGKITMDVKYVMEFLISLAKSYGFRRITASPDHFAVKYILKKYGFNANEWGDYERQITAIG
jgi:hypothetical protein